MNVDNRNSMSQEDADLFAQQVREIIGQNKPYHFSKKSGIGANTLSRILNGQSRRSCSIAMLNRLLQYADESSTVTLDDLKRSNNIPLSDSNSTSINIIEEDLYGYSHLLEYFSDHIPNSTCKLAKRKLTGGIQGFDADIIVSLQDKTWNISNDMVMAGFEKHKRDFVENYSSAFTSAVGMAVAAKDNSLYSFVIDQPDYFHKYAEVLKTMRLKNRVSIILANYNITTGLTHIEESCCLDSDGIQYPPMI